MERRKNDRFKVPGAQIAYTLPHGESSLVPLVDLTKCSAKFQTRHMVELGTAVNLEIVLPENESISLKSRVIRLSDPHNEKMTGAVVLFMPFGTFEEYNSIQSYDQLSHLASTYLPS
jgi:hypothetical protein